MKKPKDQYERLLRIILVSWFLILILFISGTTYAVVEISKIKQNYADLANKPSQIVKTIETQLQPIYTSIEGSQGPRGEDGKDSISTNTTTIIKTETSIPGPKGDTGSPGTNGKPGRSIELGFNPENSTWFQRYVGSDDWSPVIIIGAK